MVETLETPVEETTYIPLVATPLKKGESPIVLDEEMTASLNSLLDSKDEGDHKLAQLTLNTCDIQKSIYWLWYLARKSRHCYRMVNLRTKASRYLQTNADLTGLQSRDESQFAEWLIDKGWMTPEIFTKLEPFVLEDLERQVANQFYKVTVQLKDEYKHISSNHDPITFKD
jgi:hypothetical protein